LVNQLLALYLALRGLSSVLLLALVVPDRWLAFQLAFYSDVVGIFSTVAYLAFVGRAIEVPLTRPLRQAWVIATLFVAAALFAIYYGFDAGNELLVLPDLDVFGGWAFTIRGPIVIAGAFRIVAFTFAVVCALVGVLRAPPRSVGRSRAVAYATAFGVLDVTFALGNAPAFATLLDVPLPASNAITIFVIIPFFGTLASFVAIGLLVRALLRQQLFGFDLKVKWTLRRGTLVVIILGAFFVVSALAEQYLQQFGWVLGGVAVGALLFALRPIERAIDRMADRAMPRTTGTPEYLAARKHEIYRAALEEATRDGSVSVKERRLLLRLASDLGIPAEDAARLEGDVLEAVA
jgi:hypothetical protein